MTKKQFVKLFGEDPKDVLGADWKNEIVDMKVLKKVEYDEKEMPPTLLDDDIAEWEHDNKVK